MGSRIFLLPTVFPIISSPIISPFGIDLSTASIGNIYYRISRDQSLLSVIDDYIEAYDPNAVQGSAVVEALVVTWVDVPLAFFVAETVSFQAVLATTGVSSYVFFFYGNSSHPDGALVGINFGDGISYVREDGNAGIEFRGNVYNAIGAFFYRVDDFTLTTNSPVNTPQSTTPPPIIPCQFDGNLRLAGGISEGFQVNNNVLEQHHTFDRLELCYNGRYNPICSRYVTPADATVICRIHGLNTQSKLGKSISF